MGIKDYRPETAVVPAGNTSLTMRGVGLEDLQILMRNHLSDLDGLVQIFNTSVKTDAQVGVMTQYAIGLIREAPLLMSSLIMLCDVENDEDDVEPYRKLSISAQLRCIEKIGELTFKEAGGPKKFIESLMKILQAAQPVAMGMQGSHI